MAVTPWFVGAFFICLFGFQFFFTVSTEKDIQRSKTLYTRVVPVVQGIERLRAQDISSSVPLRSVLLSIVEKTKVAWDTVTLREEPFAYGEPGIWVELHDVNLVQLVAFLKTCRRQTSLRFLSFAVERSTTQSVLANAKILLVR